MARRRILNDTHSVELFLGNKQQKYRTRRMKAVHSSDRLNSFRKMAVVMNLRASQSLKLALQQLDFKNRMENVNYTNFELRRSSLHTLRSPTDYDAFTPVDEWHCYYINRWQVLRNVPAKLHADVILGNSVHACDLYRGTTARSATSQSVGKTTSFCQVTDKLSSSTA